MPEIIVFACFVLLVYPLLIKVNQFEKSCYLKENI